MLSGVWRFWLVLCSAKDGFRISDPSDCHTASRILPTLQSDLKFWVITLHLRAAFRDDKPWSCTNLYFEICRVEDLILFWEYSMFLLVAGFSAVLVQATGRKKVRPNGFAFSFLYRRIVPPLVRATIIPTGVLGYFLPVLLASTHRVAPNDFTRTTTHKPPSKR